MGPNPVFTSALLFPFIECAVLYSQKRTGDAREPTGRHSEDVRD